MNNISIFFSKSNLTLTTSLSRQSSSRLGQRSVSDGFLQKQFRHLIDRFSDRTKRMRNQMEVPATPTSQCSISSQNQHKNIHHSSYDDDDDDVVVVEENKMDEKSLAGPVDESVMSIIDDEPASEHNPECRQNNNTIFCCCNNGSVLDPQGRFYISWLFIVTLTFLYNSWVIPLRTSFPVQTHENKDIWLAIDICTDVIYLIDLLFIKHRTMYLYEGFWIRQRQLTRKNYMRKLQFKLDVISLLPLDLFYLKLGTNAVYLRAPRLLKIQTFWEFFKLLDRVIISPHILRVVNTLSYMLYMIHLTACAYFAFSDFKGKC